jgi:hypothetical protein
MTSDVSRSQCNSYTKVVRLRIVSAIDIYLWLYSLFVARWPLFQYLNPIHRR